MTYVLVLGHSKPSENDRRHVPYPWNCSNRQCDLPGCHSLNGMLIFPTPEYHPSLASIHRQALVRVSFAQCETHLFYTGVSSESWLDSQWERLPGCHARGVMHIFSTPGNHPSPGWIRRGALAGVSSARCDAHLFYAVVSPESWLDSQWGTFRGIMCAVSCASFLHRGIIRVMVGFASAICRGDPFDRNRWKNTKFALGYHARCAVVFVVAKTVRTWKSPAICTSADRY